MPDLLVEKREVPFDELKVGMKASLERTFSEGECSEFKNLFRGRLSNEVPAALLAGMVSALHASKITGLHYVYTKQSLEFLFPVFPGERIVAVTELVEKIKNKKIAVFRTECKNQEGKVVLRETASCKYFI